MASIVLTPDEHQVFTNAWRAEMPYIDGTRGATPDEIMSAARNVYENYPEIKKVLGL